MPLFTLGFFLVWLSEFLVLRRHDTTAPLVTLSVQDHPQKFNLYPPSSIREVPSRHTSHLVIPLPPRPCEAIPDLVIVFYYLNE
jgi:hypothetical protein